MSFNINQYKSNGLTLGGARPALFDIQITPPSGLTSTTNTQKLTLQMSAASLPPSNLGTVMIPYFGRLNPIAGDRTFENWAVTIQNDEDFISRAIFEKWSNRINSLVGNIRIENAGSMEDYMVDATVTQYGKNGTAIRSYQFVNLFPTTIAAIDLDWGTQNAIETFAVNFAYWYWEPVNEGTYGADSYVSEIDTNDTD